MSWKETLLGDIIDFYDNKRIPLSSTQREQFQGHYRYYGAQGVIDYVKEYVFDGSYLLVAEEDGENLRSRNQPIAFEVYGKFWVNNHAHIIKGKLNIADDKFIQSLLNTISIDAYVTGAAQPKLSQVSMKAIKVRVPDFLYQQKIARILSAYDDLIENNLKRIKLLEEMTQITYEEWFVRMKFPGYEQTVIDSETGLPEGWNKQRLGELLVLNYGKALKADDRKEGVIPVYGSAGIVGSHDQAFVNGPGIIVGRKGNVGSVFWSTHSFWPIDTVFYVTSEHPLQFVHFLLKYIEFINNDAAVPGLNRNAAYMIKVTLPAPHLVMKFSIYVEKLFKNIENLSQQNQLLKEARDILLPRLMTGMIDVDTLDVPDLLANKNTHTDSAKNREASLNAL